MQIKIVKFLKRKNIIFYLLLFSDLFTAFSSFLLAYYFRDIGPFRYVLDGIQPIHEYLYILPFSIMTLIMIFYSKGLYFQRVRANFFLETYTITQSCILWLLIMMSGAYLLKTDYSRVVVFLYFIISLLAFILVRFLLKQIQRFLLDFGIGVTNIIIIGDGRNARQIAANISYYKNVGSRIVGFVSIAEKDDRLYLGSLSKLSKIINNHHVHEVYIADSRLSTERIFSIVTSNLNKNIKFRVITNAFGLITGRINLANLESIPALDINRANFSPWKLFYKRVFDIVLAIFFIILFLPVYIILVFLIKLDSAGSVFVVQKRVGLNGKIFDMFKFRTMHSFSNLYKKSPKSRQDARVTRIGMILRKYSLDELPQFINVLKGDMSLVGPRPEMDFIVKKYSSWERMRLLVKPGLTGLWQVLGRKDLPLTKNLEYDFYYINNHSFILDLVILFKTIPAVISGKGAY